MKINGWQLQWATTHGIREWRNDDGAVRMFGHNALTPDQLAAFEAWLRQWRANVEAGSLENRGMPAVSDPVVTPEELAELLQNDAYVLTDGWSDED